MARLVSRRRKKVGSSPGTLVYEGEKRLATPRVTRIDYDPEGFREDRLDGIDDCFPFQAAPAVTWLNIDGLHDVSLIEQLGKRLDLHPLMLEDILHTNQRPKFEDFEGYIYIVLNMLSYNQDRQGVQTEQVSLVLGTDYVLSFQEQSGDVFDPVRERIRNNKGRIRKMQADYLAYALLDSIVDNYFLILEKVGEKIELVEDELVSDPTERTLHQIHTLKRELVFLRKSVWPLRELVNAMQRSESGLIRETTDIYLRDVYDHTIQVIDTVESYRDVLSGMLDMYLSSISNRTNSIMKVLTVIATVFIPLTFIAGVYGMNFRYMPELQWRFGYAAVMLLMTAVVMVMLVYFRRKKWL